MNASGARYPRVCIAALGGDGGKTLVSLSLLSACRGRGREVRAFKKGPDFIDAAWLTWASGATARNLDTFLCEPERVRSIFQTHALRSGLNLIEGNRGLFDGGDARGTHSTAELAHLLDCPVILVVNATKATRTLAVPVLGVRALDARLNLAGVVLNRIGGERHRRVATEAIEELTGLPVLGAIPRQEGRLQLPMRHLGLVPPQEYTAHQRLRGELDRIAARWLDLERILELAGEAPALPARQLDLPVPQAGERVRIGVLRDSAFTFYYPENLEALEAAGAELVPVSPLHDPVLPMVDGLYIGGGFPETHAGTLVHKTAFRQSVHRAAHAGMPIYAECGGLIYLARELEYEGRTYPMCDVLPLRLTVSTRPRGHGYSEAVVDRDNPFFPRGMRLRGHEFHYSQPVSIPEDLPTVLRLERGQGAAHGRCGIVQGRTFATYLHVHAAGVPGWAAAIVDNAQQFSRSRIPIEFVTGSGNALARSDS